LNLAIFFGQESFGCYVAKSQLPNIARSIANYFSIEILSAVFFPINKTISFVEQIVTICS
jgi:hypothetical protein